jgi:4-amino-4-deoxy-L-arabinose transferase-like glycosyltransferase
VTGGRHISPYFNEVPFFDKPVLFHQLQSAAMLMLGPTELAARIVPALASLALIDLTAWFGARTVLRDVGITAGLLLAASPGILGLSRDAILDTLFTTVVFGGAALLAVATLCGRSSFSVAGYVSIGIGVLVKGPLALIVCGLTLVIASMAVRRRASP